MTPSPRLGRSQPRGKEWATRWRRPAASPGYPTDGNTEPTSRPSSPRTNPNEEWTLLGSLPGHVAGRLRGAYVRAVSGGRAARRGTDVILALVALRACLDPALGFTRQVIVSWAKRMALDPPLVKWVAQAWAKELEHPSPPGKPKGPIALIVTQLRKLGWEPTGPGLWRQGAELRDVRDLEGQRSHLDRALALSRWEALAAWRRDFAGAEDGIDEDASFREPLKAFDGRRNTTFGTYAGILSGGTWTRDRHSRAGFDVDPCCPVCKDTKETPVHRWWVCPKWDALQSLESRKLACLGAEADSQPKCLWECGLLPSPGPGDCPPGLRPPPKRRGASPCNGDSLGNTSSSPTPRLCAPRTPTLGGQRACLGWQPPVGLGRLVPARARPNPAPC